MKELTFEDVDEMERVALFGIACNLEQSKALIAKVKQMDAALRDMLFAHENADPDFPHQFEIEARIKAESALLKKRRGIKKLKARAKP